MSSLVYKKAADENNIFGGESKINTFLKRLLNFLQSALAQNKDPHGF